MQLTALGNPKLLERTSAGLKAIEGLFADFDLNKDHQISHEEFNQALYRRRLYSCLLPSLVFRVRHRRSRMPRGVLFDRACAELFSDENQQGVPSLNMSASICQRHLLPY